jgi:hypothetical protein
MTAVVVLEYGLDTMTNAGVGANAGTPTTNSTSIGARQQMLALAGDFGTVATGYLQTAGYDFGSKYNVVAGSAVSPLGNIVAGQGFYIGDKGAAARAQRALAYISPNMGGLVVALNYSTALVGTGNLGLATTTADTQTTATLVSADYTTGALSVGGVYLTTNAGANSGGTGALGANTGGADTNVAEYALGASYNFGSVAVKGTYQDKMLNTTGAHHNTVASVGATVPVGPGTVAVSFAQSSIGTAKDTDANGYTVAYLQGLSKTTTAYVAFNSMAQGTATSGVSVLGNTLGAVGNGGTSSVLATGLSKKF